MVNFEILVHLTTQLAHQLTNFGWWGEYTNYY